MLQVAYLTLSLQSCALERGFLRVEDNVATQGVLQGIR